MMGYMNVCIYRYVDIQISNTYGYMVICTYINCLYTCTKKWVYTYMYIYIHTHISIKHLIMSQISLCDSSTFYGKNVLTYSCSDIFFYCRDSQQIVLTSTTLPICSALFLREIRDKHGLNANFVWALVCINPLNSSEFKAFIFPCADYDNKVGKVPYCQRHRAPPWCLDPKDDQAASL